MTKTDSKIQLVPENDTAFLIINSVNRRTATPKTMLGMACGRKATKSNAMRPGSLERRTTHEKATEQTSVTVGVNTIRMKVLLMPSSVRAHGRGGEICSD